MAEECFEMCKKVPGGNKLDFPMSESMNAEFSYNVVDSIIN